MEDKGVQVGLTLENYYKILIIKRQLMIMTMYYLKDYNNTKNQLEFFEEQESIVREIRLRRRARKLRALKALEERLFWGKPSRKVLPMVMRQRVMDTEPGPSSQQIQEPHGTSQMQLDEPQGNLHNVQPKELQSQEEQPNLLQQHENQQSEEQVYEEQPLR